MVTVTVTVAVGIVITTVVIGMPIRGGFMRYHRGMAAVTIGQGNAGVDGDGVATIAVVCDITVVCDILIKCKPSGQIALSDLAQIFCVSAKPSYILASPGGQKCPTLWISRTEALPADLLLRLLRQFKCQLLTQNCRFERSDG